MWKIDEKSGFWILKEILLKKLISRKSLLSGVWNQKIVIRLIEGIYILEKSVI